MHCGDLHLCTRTDNNEAFPGIALQRTLENSTAIALTASMQPEEKQSLEMLGTAAALFTLRAHEIPAHMPAFTPLHMRMSMNPALQPARAVPDLNSGMVIRTQLPLCPHTGECATLQTIAKHVGEHVSTNAQLQLGPFMSSVVVKMA
jgi:hypothetical protein